MPFIPKENYSDRFFAEILVMVKKYGTIYYTSDNNCYRSEESAKMRVSDALALREIVKYAKITESNMPTNADELYKLMGIVEEQSEEEEIKEKNSFVSEEETEKALAELKAKRGESSDSESKSEEYEAPKVEVKEVVAEKKTRKSKK